MTRIAKAALSRVPGVTPGFWIIKIAAATLGETGGDAVTMSMNLDYLGIAPGGLTLLYAVYAAATIVSLPVLGRLSDLAGRRRMIIAALGLNSAGGLGLLQNGLRQSDYTPAVLALLLGGLGHGAINFGAAQRVNELAPPAHRAMFTRIFNVIRYVGTGFPVLAVGVLAAYVGLVEAFTDFAYAIYALSAIFLLLILLLRGKDRARENGLSSNEKVS